MAFTASKKLVEIKLDYVSIGESDIIVIKTEQQRKLFNGKIKTAKAKFSRPNWFNFNIYIDGCVKEDVLESRTEVDTMKLRKNKFNTLLEELIDGDGKIVTLDNEFYNTVLPDFAIGLVEAYDTYLNNEKLKFIEEMGIDIFKKDEETDTEEKKEEIPEKKEDNE
jgi:hypothetical protein